MIVDSAAQDKTTMIVAVKVKVKHIHKPILLNGYNGSRGSAVSFGIGLAIPTSQPSRIGLYVIIACEIIGGVEGIQCLERNRGRHVFEIVLDRHVFDVSCDIGGEPCFTTLEIGVRCVGQSVSWEGGTLKKVTGWCCESGYNRYQNESSRNEGQRHDCRMLEERVIVGEKDASWVMSIWSPCLTLYLPLSFQLIPGIGLTRCDWEINIVSSANNI
jgi:hypothetical protein